MDPRGEPAASGLHEFFAPPVVDLPPPPLVVAPVPASESGLRIRTALLVTGVALLLSFLLARVAARVGSGHNVLDERLRLALVLTLAFYVLVGCALVWFCLHRKVRLTWVRGHVADALVIGLSLGLVGGALAVALNSAIAGHLSSDPSAELLVGGGGVLRVVLTLMVTTVLAPLVEETVFRGILAGTVAGVDVRPAIWLSALAFAVWHTNLVSLRYYVLVGLLLGFLWHKRGLLCSVLAHAAFNGVLTLTAVVATSGAGHLTHYGALSFSLPGGWHVVEESSSPSHLSVAGPAGAGLRVSSLPVGASLSSDGLMSAQEGPLGRSDVAVVPRTRHRMAVPGGEAVVADLVVQGQPGHLLQLLDRGTLYQVIIVTAGSPGAERDWQHVLDTTRVGT